MSTVIATALSTGNSAHTRNRQTPQLDSREWVLLR